jgi:1-acyl-sn-glycerol-3-phosphate acyltransferase
VRDPLVPLIKAVGIPAVRLWWRWRFEGLDRIPRTGPALIACNHLSYFDPVSNSYAVLKAGRVPRFLAKNELFRVPVLGSFLRAHGQIPVVRGVGDQSPLQKARDALSDGEVVLIYPEGTVTKRPDHLPMQGKTGIVRLALEAEMPVIPMASWGSAPIWQKSGKGSLRPGRPIWSKVGDPIDLRARGAGSSDYGLAKKLTNDVMATLTSLVEDLRSRYPERWAGDG